MDFEVFNQQTGERLGMVDVRYFTYWSGAERRGHLTANTREGSFQTDGTSTPSTQTNNISADFGVSVFTLHA